MCPSGVSVNFVMANDGTDQVAGAAEVVDGEATTPEGCKGPDDGASRAGDYIIVKDFTYKRGWSSTKVHGQSVCSREFTDNLSCHVQVAVRDAFVVRPTGGKWVEFDPPDPSLSDIASACETGGNHVAIWWDYLKQKPPKTTSKSSNSSSSSSSSNSGKKRKKRQG